MARRSSSNNFLNIMRTMLSFLDDRLDANGLNIDVQMHPGGMFIARLRNRVVDLINNRGEAADGMEVGIHRPRRARADAASAEERGALRRCNRMLDADRQNQELSGEHPAETASSPEDMSVPEEPESIREGGRVLRIVFPYTPTQELRLLFFSPQQTNGSRETVVYELQINFDTVEGASEPPVTATKQALRKNRILRARVSDESCECAICMISFIRAQRLRKLPCEHKFHVECVDKWLLGHSNKCPVCRNAI